MIYYDIFEKNNHTFFRLDITNIFSKKNKAYYKFEFSYKDKSLREIYDYSILNYEEDDECSYFVVFDITDIDLQLIKHALLIQYKKFNLSKSETTYHTFRISKEEIKWLKKQQVDSLNMQKLN